MIAEAKVLYEDCLRQEKTGLYVRREVMSGDLSKALLCVVLVATAPNHVRPYIVKVQACGFFRLTSSLIMAFFVALRNHLTLWPQFGHLYLGDNTLTPVSLCG